MLRPAAKLPKAASPIGKPPVFEQDLREFVRKGMEVAAIEIPGKDARHVALAVSAWLRKHPDKFPGVRCAKRGETAYLYKE